MCGPTNKLSAHVYTQRITVRKIITLRLHKITLGISYCEIAIIVDINDVKRITAMA